MAMAVQNLVWGITQPFAGAFADRYGTGRTVAAGLVVYAAGLVLMSISPNAGWMTITAGMITGAAIAPPRSPW